MLEDLSEFILFTLSSTCFDDHQLKSGLRYFCSSSNSSKDSTKGAPNVSGSSKANTAEAILADPKISNGNSSKVITGRYNAT